MSAKNDTLLPKVNKDFIKDLIDSKTGSKVSKAKSGEEVAARMLKDSRFGQMFTDKDFVVDKHSEAYKLIKPQGGDAAKRLKDEDVDSAEEDEE